MGIPSASRSIDESGCYVTITSGASALIIPAIFSVDFILRPCFSLVRRRPHPQQGHLTTHQPEAPCKPGRRERRRQGLCLVPGAPVNRTVHFGGLNELKMIIFVIVSCGVHCLRHAVLYSQRGVGGVHPHKLVVDTVPNAIRTIEK